jgi:hypothetical protein
MHIQIAPFLAYRDGELEASERQAIESHLEGCPTCRQRYDALELLAKSIKTHFDAHPPEKKADCPHEAHWLEYLDGKMSTEEHAQWKEHITRCDACFDTVASLAKQNMEALDHPPLHPPQWWKRPSKPALRKWWIALGTQLKQSLALPKWHYMAVGGLAAILLVISSLWWQQMTRLDNLPLAELPGKSIQSPERRTYQLFVPSEQTLTENLVNALTATAKPLPVVAQLTAPFVEALQMLGASSQEAGLKHLTVELEKQFITRPENPIGGVLVERELARQLQTETYTPNQQIWLTFLTPENESSSKSLLKIELSR